ncbi:unnamed protein product, partial [Closterium sp. Yama58-4]
SFSVRFKLPAPLPPLRPPFLPLSHSLFPSSPLLLSPSPPLPSPLSPSPPLLLSSSPPLPSPPLPHSPSPPLPLSPSPPLPLSPFPPLPPPLSPSPPLPLSPSPPLPLSVSSPVPRPPDLDWQQLAQVAVSFSQHPFHPACPPPTASLSIPPHLEAPLSAAASAIAERARQLLSAFSSSPQADQLLLQQLAACRVGAGGSHGGQGHARAAEGSGAGTDGAEGGAKRSKEAVGEEGFSAEGRVQNSDKAGSGTAGAEGCEGVEFDASVCTAQVMRTLGQREMVVRFRLGKKLLLQRLAARLDDGACIQAVVGGNGEAPPAATPTPATS